MPPDAEARPEPADVTHPALLAEQYADSRRLAARRRIYAYDPDPVDFPRWALDHLEWRGGETVVDVGCGDGLYLSASMERGAQTAIGIDRSVGMLSATPAGPARVAADAVGLPLATACADVVLAMHMLYHVADTRAAVDELRRVLRPGGALLAATNGDGHMAELQELLTEAVRMARGTDLERPDFSARWDLDIGSVALRSVFGRVERVDLRRRLVVSDPVAVTEYVMSKVPANTLAPVVRAEVEHCAARVIEEHGAFEVSTHSGVLLAS